MPASLDGEPITVHAAFGDEQWSWRHINLLGGMNPDNPRHSDNPQVSYISDSQLIADRLCQLDVCDTLEENEALSVSKHAMQPYFSAEALEEIATFSLPDWLGYGYWLSDRITGVVANVYREKQALLDLPSTEQQFGENAKELFAKTKLAVEINQRYFYGVDFAIDQEPVFIQRFFDEDPDNDYAFFGEEGETYRQQWLEANRDNYLPNSASLVAHAQNYRAQEGARRERIVKRYEDLKKCREQVYENQIRQLIRATYFENKARKISEYQQQFNDLLTQPSFVAIFSDYANLGSDDDPAKRFIGLAHMSELFEGAMHDVFDVTSGCVMDYQLVRRLQKQNPLPDTMKKLVGSTFNKHPLYQYTFDIANLAPNFVAQFNQTLAEPLTPEAAANLDADALPGIAELVRHLPPVRNPNDTQTEPQPELSSVDLGLAKQLCKIPLVFVLWHNYDRDVGSARYRTGNSPLYTDPKTNEQRPPKDFDEAVSAQQQEAGRLTTRRNEIDIDIAKNVERQASIQTELSNISLVIEEKAKELEELQASENQLRHTELKVELKSIESYQASQKSSLDRLQAEQTELQRQRTRVDIYVHEQNANTRQMRSAAQRNAATKTSSAVPPIPEDVAHLNKKLGVFQNMMYGSQVLPVQLTYAQLLDGDFPANLQPANAGSVFTSLQKEVGTINQVMSSPGPKVPKKLANGTLVYVPASALKNQRSEVDRLLNKFGAVLTDMGSPEATNELNTKQLTLYMNKVEVDLTFEQGQHLTELKQANERVKTLTEELESARLQQSLGSADLRALQAELDSAFTRSLAAQKEVSELRMNHIRESRYPRLAREIDAHFTTNRIALAANGGMLAFNVHFAIEKMHALLDVFSWQAAIEFLASMTDLVDTFASSLELAARSIRQRGTSLGSIFQNRSPEFKLRLKAFAKWAGVAGGGATFVQGMIQYSEALRANNDAMLYSANMAMASGVLSVLAFFATGPVALYLGGFAIALAIGSAVLSMLAPSEEQLLLAHLPLGRQHSEIQSETAMVNVYATGEMVEVPVKPDNYKHFLSDSTALHHFNSFVACPNLSIDSTESGVEIVLPEPMGSPVQSYQYAVLVRPKDFFRNDYEKPWHELLVDHVVAESGCFGLQRADIANMISVGAGKNKTIQLSKQLLEAIAQHASQQLDDRYKKLDIRLLCATDKVIQQHVETAELLGFGARLPASLPPHLDPGDAEINIVDYAGYQLARFNQKWWYAKEIEYAIN